MKEQRKNFLERIIYTISPTWALNRTRTKEAIRKYEAASRDTRRTANWQAPGSGPSIEAAQDLHTLRNRSRDMFRNNGYFRKAINDITVGLVGSGMRPSISGVSEGLEAKIMEEWRKWADKRSCDFRNRNNFAGLQAQVVRNVAMSGEALILKRYTGDVNNPIELEVVEGDYLATEYHGTRVDNGGFVRYGIEFNRRGKVVALHLYKYHPGETYFPGSGQYQRVPIESVIHVFWEERSGQFRGVPWGVAAMIGLRDFDEYEDATLVRRKVAACFSVFVHDISGESGIPGEEPDQMAEKIEPGIIEHLPPGKTISLATPPPDEGHESFTKTSLRKAAAGFGSTYEAVASDYSNVNYSSGKLGNSNLEAFLDQLRNEAFSASMFDRVFEWFFEHLQLKGVVPYSMELPPVTWTPPGKRMIEPVKETKGLIAKLQAGLISYKEAAKQLGRDPEELLKEIAEAKKQAEKMGISFEWMKSAQEEKKQEKENKKE